MNTVLKSSDLFKACTIASQCGIKGSLPVTTHLQIVSQNNKAALRYTDLEKIIELYTNEKMGSEGECFIPLRRLAQFTKYEKNPISILADGKSVTLSSKHKDTAIDGIKVRLYSDKIDYEPTVVGEPIDQFTLPDNIQTKIGYALKCAAQEDSRPILSGVLFDYDGDQLNLVSCDGFHLVNVNISAINTMHKFRIVIPANTLKLVSRFMEGQIKFGYNTKKCWFKTDKMLIISQLIQGSYPAWLQLIPAAPAEWSINVSAPMLNQRLNQLDKSDTMGIVKMFPQSEYLTLSHSEKEFEDTEILIPAKMKGEGKIAFNKKYLIEVSKIFSEMNIEITTPTSPLKITGDLEGVTFVIMPIFTQW